MSFQRTFPRTFSPGSILVHAPAASGVYGISNHREWLVIQSSANIQADLLAYATGAESHELSALMPTGFTFETCHESIRHGRRDALVKQYLPVYTTSQS
ncbi:MAG TPA: hypothetical protein VER03_13475 [Bryobacteraceae bacterium]|nr:hypothetical protein [Bryobacteraceae bacterium]